MSVAARPRRPLFLPMLQPTRAGAAALLCAAVSVFATPGAFSPAWADGRLPAGSAIEIKNVVTGRIEKEKDKRRLESGQPVFVNELIEANKDSRGELQLRDDTKLVVAEGARLVLDKYVYDPNATAGAVVLNLSKGAMRFVTGKSAKEAYEIKTPVATIGVRGTIFDAFVSPQGELAVLLIEGAVEVCTGEGTQRRCRLHDRVGEFVYVRRGSPIRQIPKYDGTFMRQQPIQAAFPFVGEPPSFNRDPVWTYDGLRPPILPLPPRGGGGRGDGGGKGPVKDPGKGPSPGGGKQTDGGGRSTGGSGGVTTGRVGDGIVVDVRIPKRHKKDKYEHRPPKRRGDDTASTGHKGSKGGKSANSTDGGIVKKRRVGGIDSGGLRRAGSIGKFSSGKSMTSPVVRFDRNPVRPFIMQPRLR